MKRLCAAVGVAVLAAAPFASADAADAVKTRAGEHAHFGRIAFDWPAPVAFEAKIDGGTLVIHFGRELETSLGSIAENIGGYVEDAIIGADGATLTAHLKRPVTLKTFTEGNTIAIDLLDAASATSRKSASRPSGNTEPTGPAAISG